MRNINNTDEKAQNSNGKREYRSPRFKVYGTVTQLTQGSSGSRADGAGSQGPGNQGSGS